MKLILLACCFWSLGVRSLPTVVYIWTKIITEFTGNAAVQPFEVDLYDHYAGSWPLSINLNELYDPNTKKPFTLYKRGYKKSTGVHDWLSNSGPIVTAVATLQGKYKVLGVDNAVKTDNLFANCDGRDRGELYDLRGTVWTLSWKYNCSPLSAISKATLEAYSRVMFSAVALGLLCEYMSQLFKFGKYHRTLAYELYKYRDPKTVDEKNKGCSSIYNEDDHPLRRLEQHLDNIGDCAAVRISWQLMTNNEKFYDGNGKEITVDPYTAQCCDMKGVKCDAARSKVTHLYWGEKGFTGEIPPAIYTLRNLQVLELNQNAVSGQKALTGPVSKDIANLKELKILNLSNNQLTEIPHFIRVLDKLEKLVLSYNQFTDLPWAIAGDGGYLPNLQYLDISKNGKLRITLTPRCGIRIASNEDMIKWNSCICSRHDDCAGYEFCNISGYPFPNGDNRCTRKFASGTKCLMSVQCQSGRCTNLNNMRTCKD